MVLSFLPKDKYSPLITSIVYYNVNKNMFDPQAVWKSLRHVPGGMGCAGELQNYTKNSASDSIHYHTGLL